LIVGLVSLRADEDRPAIIDSGDGRSLTFGELKHVVDERAEQLSPYSGRLVSMGASMKLPTVVDYLALVRCGATLALLDPETPEAVLSDWISRYDPAATWGFAHRPDFPCTTRSPEAPRLERILLPTSGSTGSPKFVRLSEQAVVANAKQIVSALEIYPDHRACAHLPLFYSYGLSVLNSHLASGATTVLCPFSAMQHEFWDALRLWKVTSLPGVPYSYEMFRRAGLFERDLPDLVDMTQAGGKLPAERVQEVHARARERGMRFWVMYGQTEATARISVLHHAELPEAAGSVGNPLQGATVRVDEPDSSGSGELIYRGPNVMLGYAEGRADLDGADLMQGQLPTGDLGRIDESGRLWITGRLKRIAKVFGTRVSLDDVEAALRRFGTLAAIDDAQGIAVVVEAATHKGATARDMERALGLPTRSLRLVVVDHLPVLTSGKLDYAALRRLA
jgi:acyl-coenzyme A synthetase/AMP-(fatty) acid ligase